MVTKKCRKCDKSLALSSFSKGKARCKKCEAIRYKEWAQTEGRDKVNECNNRYYKKNSLTPDYRFIRYKAQSKTRGKEFLLTKEEFKSIYGKSCVYCGDVNESMGLDRVNSNNGYVIGNVVSCCRRCNQAKNDMTLDEFIGHCRKIAKNYETYSSTGIDSD